MDMYGWPAAAVVTGAFTCGMLLLSYEHLAEARNWLVGRFLRGTGWLHALTLLEILAAVVISLIVVPWWSVFVTIIGGLAIGFALSEIFRWWVQLVAIAGAVTYFIVAPAYVW